MSPINVLVVGDGLDLNASVPQGISFAPRQDVTDDHFTVSEFIWLLRNNPAYPVTVDTANRRNDPYATLPNFHFSAAALAKYQVLWLIGYEGWNYADYGSPVGDDERLAIMQFMQAGHGVFATGDHSGMGSAMCGNLPRVRAMRKWFGRSSDIPAGAPTAAISYSGASVSAVNWPGLSAGGVQRADTLQHNPSDMGEQWQFDNQSDAIPQPLTLPGGSVHPVLSGPNGAITHFPDHMHEGEVVTPADLHASVTILGETFTEWPAPQGAAQPVPHVIATGAIVGGHTTVVQGSACEQNNFTGDSTPTSAATLGVLCAYDGHAAGVGRVVTDSSFHHSLDLNLIGDPCGASADRQVGFGPAGLPPSWGGTLANLQAFYVNTVLWLAGVAPVQAVTQRSRGLDAYWGSDSSQHINFIGNDGHVRELFIHPGAKWTNNDLTGFSHATVLPAAGSALDGYWGSDSSQHVNYVGTDGHVHELYIHPGANWVDNDLTATSKSRVLPSPGTAIDGYWGSDSSQHVNYIGADGHVHELYIHPNTQWVDNDLTAMSKSRVAPLAGTSLDGYWGSDSSQHVNYVGSDGHVHELYIHPGAAWTDNDLTALSHSLALPAPGTPLDGYWGSDASQHVNYIGTDGHVHELYIHPGANWVDNDLTVMSHSATMPASGTPLHGYWGSDSSQHVNYIGADGHVHELYIHPGANWVDNDLTALSHAAVVPRPGSPVFGYWGSDSSQHVIYAGADGHVHELYIHPGATWMDNDVTAMSGGGVVPA